MGGNSRPLHHISVNIQIFFKKMLTKMRPPTPKCYSQVKQIVLCYNLQVHKAQDSINVTTNWNSFMPRRLFPYLLLYHTSAHHAEAPVHQQLQHLLVPASCHLRFHTKAISQTRFIITVFTAVISFHYYWSQ